MQLFNYKGPLQIYDDGGHGGMVQQLKSGEKGVPATKVRSFRFVLRKRRYSYGEWGYCTQFCCLKFISQNGMVFQYSSNDDDISILRKEVSQSTTDENGERYGDWEDGGNEDPLHGLMDIGTKCCIGGLTEIAGQNDEVNKTLYITYDLNKDLDLKVYNKWYFYTANDFSSRDPWDFSLEVLNSEEQWKEVNRCSTGVITSDRHELAYEGTINLDNLQ